MFDDILVVVTGLHSLVD